MLVRISSPADDEDIRIVDSAAYGRFDEAALTDNLRANGDVVAELVALKNGAVIGHILFARLCFAFADGTVREGAVLAVLAVIPLARDRGVASALVEVGLDACRATGAAAVVALGPPNFFPRFGFSAEAARLLSGPFSGRSFMAIELAPASLTEPARLGYPRAFGFS